MAELFDRLTKDIAYVQQLGDNPNSENGLTAAELRAWFDKAPVAIKTYLNESLIPQVESKFGSVDAWITEANDKFDRFVTGSGFLPVDGSIAMSGNLNMNGKQVQNVAAPKNDSDAVNKKYADDINAVASNAKTAADSKCSKQTKTVSLAATGWSGKYLIVSVPGVLSDADKCDVLVSPLEESREVYNDCVVRCTAQGNGTLKFMCDDVPDVSLTVGVIILI